MPRILKRPMFRSGGSTNEGIMEGLKDRQSFDNGTEDPYETRVRDRSEIIQRMLNEYAPVPKTKIPYGQFGADIAMGTPIKEALYKGYTGFTTADDKRRASMANRKAQSVGLAMGDVEKQLNLEKQLKARAALNDPENVFQTMQYKDAYEEGRKTLSLGVQEARLYADYETKGKKLLENEVGTGAVADMIIDFDVNNSKTVESRKKQLKNNINKFFYDVTDNSYKQLIERNGKLVFSLPAQLNQLLEGAPTPKVVKPIPRSINPSYNRPSKNIIGPAIKRLQETQTPVFDIEDIG